MADIRSPQLSVSLPTVSNPTTTGGGWSFYLDHPSNWCYYNDWFTTEELDAIIRLGEQTPLQKGVTKGNADGVRDSFVSFLFPNDKTDWVFQKLTTLIITANENWFGFDLYGLNEGIQFTKYSAPADHYTWHADRGPNTPVRKLSMSLLLSDPNEYEGGDLQLKYGPGEETAERKRGSAVFFPSWTLHRVTPVTEGTRYSLVAWVTGPPFR